MLVRLTVKNLALLAQLDLAVPPGFAALTGETGAGKSLLLDALGLLLGQRADAGLIRHGEALAEVTGVFTPSLTPKLHILLEDQGLSLENNELTIRRQIKREAGAKAWANGVAVPLAWLVQVGECLAEVQAQHSAPALLQPAHQRTVLDAAGGLEALVAATAHSYGAWQAAQGAADAAARACQAADAMQEVARENLQLLDSLGYSAGEEEQLAAQRTRVQFGAQLAGQLQAADDALNAERGAVQALRIAAKQLQHAAKLDEALTPLASQLQEALVQTEDAAHSVARQAALGLNEESLEAIDDRLHALKTAARRVGCSIAELAQQQEQLKAQLTGSAELGAVAAAHAATAAKHAQEFKTACTALTAARQAAAAKLVPQLQTALRALLLPHAEVAVALTPLPTTAWGPQGAEGVQIMLAANPGSPVQPLQKVASGGELARLLLALKQVFYANLPPQVLVLDEVDTGLSGAAASAVGAAMAALGMRHQVLAVTHHAQVAVRGQTHGRLLKQVLDGATTTQLQWLQGPARLEELARLLAGENITPEARAAAQALLAEAQGKQAA